MVSKILIKKLKKMLKISLFVVPLLAYVTCRYIENFLNLVFYLSKINLNTLSQIRLNDLYSFRFSITLVSIAIIGFLYALSYFILCYPKIKYKSKKDILKNLIVLVLTILIFLSVFNFVIQRFNIIPKSEFKKVQNGTQGYVPFATTIFYGTVTKLKPTSIKINSYGFRDYEYSISKPNNTFRIIGLGDSNTFGWGVELNETYLKVLEKRLNKNLKSKKYEMLNLGVIGLNTLQEVELFKEKGRELNPDLIIIGFTSNDIEDGNISMPIIEDVSFDFENSKIPLLKWIALRLETYKINKVYKSAYSNPEKYFDKNVKAP